MGVNQELKVLYNLREKKRDGSQGQMGVGQESNILYNLLLKRGQPYLSILYFRT